MSNRSESSPVVATLDDLAPSADYSLMDTLNCDPDGKKTAPTTHRGSLHGPLRPRQTDAHRRPRVRRAHDTFFVNLGSRTPWRHRPTSSGCSPATSRTFQSPAQSRLGNGLRLSIFGTEYTQQCPFQTGNGYGDGRAISVLEAVLNGRRWEMQLKVPAARHTAVARTVVPCCGRVSEFLFQEHIHALGVPTSRSLSLYVSKTEKVRRPWYSEGSRSPDPDRLISESVAIDARGTVLHSGSSSNSSLGVRAEGSTLAMEELNGGASLDRP